MRRLVSMAAGVGMLAGAAACGGGSAPTGLPGDQAGPAGQPPASSVQPEAVTADPPLAFDTGKGVSLPRTALQANVAGSVTSKFMTLRDRTGYLVAPDSLSAVDVLTGSEKWNTKIEGPAADPNAHDGPFVEQSGPRPPLVTGKLAVAAVPLRMPEQGTTPGYVALAVLAVNPETGAKAWQTNAKVTDDQYGISGGRSVTHVVAVTDKAVVASFAQSDHKLTVALDPASGKQLWERKDYDAGSLNGDVVVGVDSNVAENSSMVQATALDVATGQQKWVAAAKSSAVEILPADPAMVVLKANEYSTGHAFLKFLDPVTGAEKFSAEGTRNLGPDSYGDCLYDEQSVLACTDSGVLTAYDAKAGTKLWSLPDQAANRVPPGGLTVAWHGALYGYTNGKQPIVLDAKTGKDLSTSVGFVPDWVSKYAAAGVDKDGAPKAYPVKK
ncbi:outer membrane protein assembly factor BamB family protein [Amycolatopsis orientalis]|uniref:outer membrane protein assembly factor BamB family protein n=1 Tax=Amycolatopsis orientalis TaxID=31958 RepID=UPI00039F5886|nr:PQQ-binding-like beta-propeller repeat protein [Amycolatopsis orientalis]